MTRFGPHNPSEAASDPSMVLPTEEDADHPKLRTLEAEAQAEAEGKAEGSRTVADSGASASTSALETNEESSLSDRKYFRHCGLANEDGGAADELANGVGASRGTGRWSLRLGPAGADADAEELANSADASDSGAGADADAEGNGIGAGASTSPQREAGPPLSVDAETTAAAAAMGGAAVCFGPALMGPMAAAGGPVLGLGAAGVLAYSAQYRPEGDTLGDLSRELGKRGVEAAKKAKSELRRLDQEHEISRKAKTVARTAWNDVQSLGQKSADEIGVLISYWSRSTPAGREAQTQAQVAAPPAASAA